MTNSRRTQNTQNMSIQNESDEPSTPTRPSAGSPANDKLENATAPNQNGAPGDAPATATTPKSAPAAGTRQRAYTKGEGPPPTLLVDFLRGRPSPARLAAQRQRRMSVDAVKAEIRQEMKQGAVQRLQQPGGVRDRVKAWQKSNAAAMAAGDPMATPSEPTEVAFPDETRSVTEDDRMRIKMRKKKRDPPKIVVEQPAPTPAPKSASSGETKPESAETVSLRKKTPPKRGSPGVGEEGRIPLDDGIRVRPMSGPARTDNDRKKGSRKPSKTPPSVVHSVAPSIAPSLSLRDRSPYDLIDRGKDAESSAVMTSIADEPNTPSRRKVSKSTPKLGQKPTSAPTEITQTTQTSKTTETTESTESTETDLPEMAGGRSPGASTNGSGELGEQPSVIESSGPTMAEIPVGKSAFSELDLPLGADARNSTKRPKPQRNPSLSAVPKVFKRVVSEGKKMMQPEPQRPVGVNKPPSIETWLTNTVDPFVDVPANGEAPNPIKRRKSAEKKWAADNQTRGAATVDDTTPKKASPQPEPPHDEDEENKTPKASEKRKSVDATTKTPGKTPPSSGLKRKGATRGVASPLKVSLKKPFREALKEAFKGQSSNQIFTQTSYESREERTYKAIDSEVSFEEECRDPQCQCQQRQHEDDGSRRRSRSPDSFDSRDFEDDRTTSSSLPEPRRRPPTNGFHELSTIVSEESCSSHDNETMSTVSQTTVTQTTVTRDSELSRRSSQKPGLKRRLTKHSDLVSVLSVPDDKSVPLGVKNARSRPSVRRTRSKRSTVTTNDLLGEFADDETFTTENSRPSLTASFRDYLDAWRLGFENLVVNLAPASDVPDDQDSLLNALPRNADGDIVNEDGERVDVAHLLRRPIARIKTLTSFVRALHDTIGSDGTASLVGCFASLQDKARKRHKEERARVTDEDAANTDTTRARDLRTLAAMGYIKIDAGLQVSAKDVFSADKADWRGPEGMAFIPADADGIFIGAQARWRAGTDRDGPGTHNGQIWRELLRLAADDEGQIDDWVDILGTLPLPPLELEPVAPVPECGSPRSMAIDVPLGAQRSLEDGQSSPNRPLSEPTTPTTPTTPTQALVPSRYHSRGPPPSYQLEVTAPQPPTHREPLIPREDAQDPAKPNATPYRSDGAPPPPIHRTFVAPKSKSKSSTLQPPANGRVKRKTSSPLKHEYLPSEASSEAEEEDDSFSESEEDESDMSSESDSSGDDIDSVDIPDTEVGVSIKHPHSEVTESLVSDASLTPSNSASQGGLHRGDHYRQQVQTEEYQQATYHQPQEYQTQYQEPYHQPQQQQEQQHQHQHQQPGLVELTDEVRFVCSVSHWHDKRGIWKDLSSHMCSVVVSDGMMEAFSLKSGRSPGTDKPLIALDLTPVVLVRKSNALDLEVRTAVLGQSKITSISGGTFRFRNSTQEECLNLYAAVHGARLKNEKYMQLENEMRFKSFGERRVGDGDENGGRRARNWFGRKNSYRASARAPARSVDEASTAASSSMSATSFLKRLTGGANLSFNIGRSSLEKQNGGGAMSFYTSGSSSAGAISSDNVPIRLHLLVSASKWEDCGNCRLQVRRPPEGWRQELRANHGLEKRVTVTTIPKKRDGSEAPRVVLDAVLGSGCFTTMGTRGIICSVWEEMRDEQGRMGHIPHTNNPGGSVKKWCFQLSGVAQASWLLTLLHEEVVRA
ncbi:unnamed protein product [Parascedosporium putredinis]|uniref:Uncharacterized protein n=1 Tax=Parascedosporium putredinis TaxID=1442378 RepID=A0A9P1GY53_9PEZI|nr:unnamed protein product [Parascedosporium putredinis]CAI7991332.1 unnamed protein product [Parascedosporium putredinis]